MEKQLTRIPIKIGPVETVYVLAITDAPKNYDGFGTITLVAFDYPLDTSDLRTKHNARVVLIREEHLQWHAGRYGSGLYCLHTEGVEDYWPVPEVAAILHGRLSLLDNSGRAS